MGPQQDATPRRRLIAVAAFIGSAIVGAVVHSMVDAHFKRAQPALESVSIGIEALDPLAETEAVLQDNSPVISPPADLASRRTEWIGDYSGTLKRPAYVAKLASDAARLNDLIRAMNELAAALQDWAAGASDAGDVFTILWDHQTLVLAHVFGEARRATPVFTGPAPARGTNTVHRLATDEDGDYYVTEGKYTIAIAWSVVDSETYGRHREHLKDQSKRLAEAIAYHTDAELTTLRTSLLRLTSRDRQELGELQKLVERERSLYSRWLVRAVVANKGTDPVAVGPTAEVFVSTRDFVVPGTQRKMITDAVLSLRLADARHATVNANQGGVGIAVPVAAGYATLYDPRIIPGGGAIAITLQSEGLVGESHDDPEGLLAAFNDGNVPCEVRVAVPTGKSVEQRLVTRKEVKFRSSSPFGAARDTSQARRGS